MLKFNHKSKGYTPTSDKPKRYSAETETRFDEACYKLDRIVGFEEQKLADEITSRFGLIMDYADVLDFIKEHRLTDDNIDEIIMSILDIGCGNGLLWYRERNLLPDNGESYALSY